MLWFWRTTVRCPFCGCDDLKVLDSRSAREGDAIRRRRECNDCNRRFTTFEGFERPRLFVVKREGDRQEFDRSKVLNSMVIACRKRPVAMEHLQEATSRIERLVFQDYEDEVPSSVIGEQVMDELYRLDSVAYVRFASVYREFESVEDFRKTLDGMGVRC
ncbi:MAG: transcriptional regulator NrdR [Fimbriimonas sp.]